MDSIKYLENRLQQMNFDYNTFVANQYPYYLLLVLE